MALNCPLCKKELGKDYDLSIDNLNMWLICSSGDHKYKLTEMIDTTRKSITRKTLSDSVMAIKNGLICNEGKIDPINEALLNGQIHAYQMLADYLCDDDWRDYLPE